MKSVVPRTIYYLLKKKNWYIERKYAKKNDIQLVTYMIYWHPIS